MKNIIIVLLALMLSGCGKIATLIQPKVVEKIVYKERIVEVPAKFSLKDEFTGKRLIVKLGIGVLVGVFGWSAYDQGFDTGRDVARNEATSSARLLKDRLDEVISANISLRGIIMHLNAVAIAANQPNA